jgi:hypothetical protein
VDARNYLAGRPGANAALAGEGRVAGRLVTSFAFFAAIVFLAQHSHARLYYQFTVRGTVTGGIPLFVGVNLGDPFVYAFLADPSNDIAPVSSPYRGMYRTANARVVFPTLSLTSSGGEVLVSIAPGQDALIALDAYPDPAWFVLARFAFPEGTFTSDAMPAHIPIALAHSNYFEASSGSFPVIIGRIDSITIAQQVPESCALWMIALAPVLARRRSGNHQRPARG